jgi:hypothetical protein
MFRRFAAMCPGDADPKKSIVYWRRQRVFAGAFILGKRLELNIDLLREAEHPLRIAVFPTTKRVHTHRLRVTEPAQLDESIAALLQEAYDDVGPGTR